MLAIIAVMLVQHTAEMKSYLPRTGIPYEDI